MKEDRPDTVIVYFYFDFNNTEKHSSKKAIRSLLFQFALQQKSRLQILEQLYQKYKDGQQQPAEEEIRSLLEDAVAHTGFNKYFILDTLDECIDREDFAILVRKLVKSQREGLHIIITSRREKDIKDELGCAAKYNINIQSAIVDEDIQTYIRDRIAMDSKLKKWPRKVQNEISTVLIEKADGV